MGFHSTSSLNYKSSKYKGNTKVFLQERRKGYESTRTDRFQVTRTSGYLYFCVTGNHQHSASSSSLRVLTTMLPRVQLLLILAILVHITHCTPVPSGVAMTISASQRRKQRTSTAESWRNPSLLSPKSVLSCSVASSYTSWSILRRHSHDEYPFSLVGEITQQNHTALLSK